MQIAKSNNKMSCFSLNRVSSLEIIRVSNLFLIVEIFKFFGTVLYARLCQCCGMVVVGVIIFLVIYLCLSGITATVAISSIIIVG